MENSSYEILRNPTQISWIAQNISKDTLSEEEFPFYGEIPESKQKQQKKGFIGKSKLAFQDVNSNPRIIMFVIGGLTH